MSIRNILNKIKPFKAKEEATSEVVEFDENGRIRRFNYLKEVYLSLVIILIATLSFGIGRLTVAGNREPVRIEYDPEIVRQPASTQTAAAINAASKSSQTSVSTGTVVGSSKGSKYHFAHCPGAKQISEANKITFESPAAAEASGYTLAGNCKPR